jgi:DNA helicase-2/ATP-dependent DNA helicase PcrA
VVYMLAVEQGLLPHERSLNKNDDVEEERRLAFVGMTRAKEELYLSHARLREFRGSAMYVVPSMFLEELPADAVQAIDLSANAGRATQAMNDWRGGSRAADPGWEDAGIQLRRPEPEPPPNGPGYVEGMLVRHDSYGTGRVTEVSGYGALRRVKIRFSTHGEKTFVADKAKLTIVQAK